MNEQHDVEAAADVRPFLPQAGEAVETYALRLRTLHRDLTLVLEAVERGLEARGASVAAPPEPASEAVVEVPASDAPEIQPPRRVMAPGPGMARVEVISTPREDEPSYGRRASELPPAVPMAAEPEPAPEPAPLPVPAAPPRFERRAEPPAAVAAPEQPPAAAPVAPVAQTKLVLPGWAPAAFLASWLTVVALLLIVLLEN